MWRYKCEILSPSHYFYLIYWICIMYETIKGWDSSINSEQTFTQPFKRKKNEIIGAQIIHQRSNIYTPYVPFYLVSFYSECPTLIDLFSKMERVNSSFSIWTLYISLLTLRPKSHAEMTTETDGVVLKNPVGPETDWPSPWIFLFIYFLWKPK